MALIQLTPEDLRTSAQKYTSGAEEVRQVLRTLSNEQETIRSNWKGSAFDSFDQQFTALSPKIDEFATLLDEINAQLLKVADIVEQTDQDIAAQIH
ncbi:Virulence factor EsxA [Streptococcus oralis]|uniref:ESAT-6-like protein n=4 Tax=Streptococcus TaxID=1301 RepID=A0A139P9M4_STROR|nr:MULTISPECIES: WXG100 family type VII secretion target [Streptococcus]EGU64022.1 type VII secretion target protein [Streptococcus mitis bv. 2 str. SK95]KXT84939.1 ESAT-6/Esx family secreted protein EsxA/YukE [Streptococcus oralis]ORO80226.1 WXG100 family type VII secretion target [Streptococcus oralis subsp. dentisani]RSI83096.1 Virulence factor EsxA [Streptococcus mitis]RSJ08909.1 Virulence factor EsxA [Streptococcus mitis]